MDMMFYLRKLILLCILLFSAIADILRYRIPNRIIVCGFVVISVLNFFSPQVVDVNEIAVMLLVLVLLFYFWTKKKMGAGDVKLFALIIFTLPNAESFEILKYGLITASILGIIILIRERKMHTDIKLPLAVCTFLGAVIESLIY